MDFISMILSENLTDELMQSSYGIEKESIRVDDARGSLALTPHPESLGDKNNHPYIQTDYSESQPEIITPPLLPISRAIDFLQAVNDVLYRALPEDELLWVNSIPGHLPENDSDIPISQTEDQETIEYRKITGEKYGRSRQLMSGLHINFSLSEELLDRLFEVQDEFETMKEFKNYVYMKISRNFIAMSWLLIYFYGATPIAKSTYFTKALERGEPVPEKPMRSIRNSTFGYFNSTDVSVRYDDIHTYITDIEDSVASQKLAAEREYYSGVRLRTPLGKQLSHLFDHGIEYLEFRSLDLNPYSTVGLTREQSEFLHLFIIYLFLAGDDTTGASIGLARAVEVAEEDPLSETAYLTEGLSILSKMEQMIYELGLDGYHDLINHHREMLQHPELTVAGRMMSEISDEDSFIEFTLNLAQTYRESARSGERDFDFLEINDPEAFYEGLAAGTPWKDLQHYID